MTFLTLDCASTHQVWHPHSFSPRLHLCLASISTNKPFLYVLSHLLGYVSNNIVPAFTVSVSVINEFFTGDNDQWKNSFQALALASMMARIPGSDPGYPGLIPGQGIKISLHTTAHCCLMTSVPLEGAQVLTLALNRRAWTELPSVSQAGAFPASCKLSPMDVAPSASRISFHSTPDIRTNGMIFSQTTCSCYL